MEENINRQNNSTNKSSTNWAKSLIVSLMMIIMAFVLTALLIYFGTKGSGLEGGMIALGIIIVVFLPLFFGGLVVFTISLEKYFIFRKLELKSQNILQNGDMSHKKYLSITIAYSIVMISVIIWLILLFLILTPN